MENGVLVGRGCFEEVYCKGLNDSVVVYLPSVLEVLGESSALERRKKT